MTSRLNWDVREKRGVKGRRGREEKRVGNKRAKRTKKAPG